MARRAALVAYDIRSDATRRRVLRILRDWRVDGQLSVHECLLTPTEAEELFIQLCEQIDPDHDRLLLAWLNPPRPIHARGNGRANATNRLIETVS